MTPIEIALSQYGVKEIAGDLHNKTIVDYARDSGFDWVNDDETPWCSIFMNWCAMIAGKPRSKSAAARSWLEVGEHVDMPETGDIIVLKRGNSTWQGHVGWFVNFNGNYVRVLGGNQGNEVNISQYKRADILEFRRI